MKTSISLCFAIQLVLCALLRTTRPAPVTTLASDMDDDLKDRSAENCLSLSHKIIYDIKEIHESCITVDNLTLDPNEDLSKWQYMMSKLGIPTATSLAPSSSVAETYSQILTDLQPYKAVLKTISNHLSNPRSIEDLLADLRELQTQITKALKHASIPPEPTQLNATSPLSDYDVQVMIHVTLGQLQRFGHEMVRVFRSQLPTDP